MEYDLEKVKLKTVSQLDDGEKEYLRQNVDKLNDEDKEAYADILTENTPDTTQSTESENTSDDEGDKGGEGSGEGNADDTSNGGSGANTTPPVLQFKSEEELKAFVLKIQHEDEVAKQEAIKNATTEEQKKYVEDNWKPKTWNDALREAVKIAKEEIRAEDKKSKEDEVGQRLQKEWEDLEKEVGLPSIKTEEGKKIHDNIVRFGLAANKSTFKEAFDVWKTVPVDHGGGAGTSYAAKTNVDTKSKEKISAQKKAAAKLGGQGEGGSGKAAGSLETPDYKTLHDAKSTADLLKKAGVLNG